MVYLGKNQWPVMNAQYKRTRFTAADWFASQVKSGIILTALILRCLQRSTFIAAFRTEIVRTDFGGHFRLLQRDRGDGKKFYRSVTWPLKEVETRTIRNDERHIRRGISFLVSWLAQKWTHKWQA
jgi:hypothetical protein